MKRLLIIFLSCHSLLIMAQKTVKTSVERYDSIVSIISSGLDWSKLDLPSMKKEERQDYLKYKASDMDKLLGLLKDKEKKGDVGALWRILVLENDSIKELDTKYNEVVAKYNYAENERQRLQKELDVRLFLERTDCLVFEDDFTLLPDSEIPDVWKDKYELIRLIRDFKQIMISILADNKKGKIEDEDKDSIYSLYDKIEGIGLHSLSKEQLQYLDELKKAFNEVI